MADYFCSTVRTSPQAKHRKVYNSANDATLEPRHGLCHIGTMVDPSTFRVIVRARNNGTGYTYLITCTDDPVWSQGTNAFYPSPEAAGEAGRVALESLLTRRPAQQ